MPAAIYIETHGGTGIGGSDDHAGIDIGRTFTETPRAATPEEFLAHLRAGHAEARGEQGSAAKWAHAAMALAARALGRGDGGRRRTRAPCSRMAERVVSEGDARGGGDRRATSARATPAACCAPGSSAVDLDARDGRADRAAAGRGVQPRRPLPPRAPRPRAPARATRCRRVVAAAEPAATSARRRHGLSRPASPRSPTPRRPRSSAREKAKLAHARRRAAPGRARGRRASAACTA